MSHVYITQFPVQVRVHKVNTFFSINHPNTTWYTTKINEYNERETYITTSRRACSPVNFFVGTWWIILSCVGQWRFRCWLVQLQLIRLATLYVTYKNMMEMVIHKKIVLRYSCRLTEINPTVDSNYCYYILVSLISEELKKTKEMMGSV